MVVGADVLDSPHSVAPMKNEYLWLKDGTAVPSFFLFHVHFYARKLALLYLKKQAYRKRKNLVAKQLQDNDQM